MLSVLIPYQPDGGCRDRTWAWLARRWAGLDDVEVIVQGGEGRGGTFEQSHAINQAANRATGDVLVIVDADVALEPGWIRDAARAVDAGAAWVLPQRYRQLTSDATEQVLAGDPLASIPSGLDTEWLGDGVSWTGGVVLRREAFTTVGGYEERFGGWGGNDVALAAALYTLWGPLTRLEGEAVHLWHPRGGLDNQPQASHDLMHRYIAARGDADAMRALISERVPVSTR